MDMEEMEQELAQLPQKAADKKSENRKFFQKLRKKKPKQLDTLVADLHDEVFEEVDCLACANCCKTISPIFTDNDIARIAKHLRMKPSQFVDTYLHLDDENDYVLNESPCAFLGYDNYCSIYEVRPKACRDYPHTNRKRFHQIFNLTLKNTEVCPATFRIVERLKEEMEG
ncbi:YkgJ family cysteine cluster protein [Pontibacter sp. G13]|uniref:YkgJ family cysteine cluster protein n=1 Tax=Pontibacter sp. G13 TaxID=3074898 RepID=UPI00288969CE|nr:YkgJ family cysteine cluster protein [Pontibacter sp. G13]WNJ16674.1 YkgJ family cysteine cluster protein [Pontibacter sp. G13]